MCPAFFTALSQLTHSFLIEIMNSFQQQPATSFAAFVSQPVYAQQPVQQQPQPAQQSQGVDLSSFANYAAQSQVQPAVPAHIQAMFQQPAQPVVQNPQQPLMQQVTAQQQFQQQQPAQQYQQPPQQQGAPNPYAHLMVPGQAPLPNMLAPQQQPVQQQPGQYAQQPGFGFPQPAFGGFPQQAPSKAKKDKTPAVLISLPPPGTAPAPQQQQAPAQQMFQQQAPAQQVYQQQAPQQQAPAQQVYQQAPAQQQMYQQQPGFQAPVQQQSQFNGVHFFESAQHPEFGILATRFPSAFKGTSSGLQYWSLEQYIAATLAVSMSDEESRQAIMNVVCETFLNTPAGPAFNWQGIEASGQQIQALQSKIKGLDLNRFNEKAEAVARQGLYYKFLQNQVLIPMLLKTSPFVLVWASTDPILGIGMTEQQARVTPVNQWGRNLLGTLLMEVRQNLATHGIEPFAWAYTMAPQPTGQHSGTRTDTQAVVPAVPQEVATPVVPVDVPVVPTQEVPAVTPAIVAQEVVAPVADVVEAPKIEQPIVAVENKADVVPVVDVPIVPAPAIPVVPIAAPEVPVPVVPVAVPEVLADKAAAPLAEIAPAGGIPMNLLAAFSAPPEPATVSK